MSDESDTRTYGGYLIIDWREANTSDAIRFRKTEPSNPAPHEIAIPVSVNVTVPDVEVPSIEADVDVPAPEVEEVVRSDL